MSRPGSQIRQSLPLTYPRVAVLRSQYPASPFAFNSIVMDVGLQKTGKRCRRGLHICWRCFKEHPFSQCTVGGA